MEHSNICHMCPTTSRSSLSSTAASSALGTLATSTTKPSICVSLSLHANLVSESASLLPIWQRQLFPSGFRDVDVLC